LSVANSKTLHRRLLGPAMTRSPDGRVPSTSLLEWIYVWDVASGTMRRKFRHPHGHGCKLALAPDGRTLATSDIRGDIHDVGEDTIRLHDVESGNQILTVEPDRRARDDAGTWNA
jgi:hypothetical protein